MANRDRSVKGFTLLEVLLVLAIASSLIVLMLNYTTQKSDELRRDKTVLQIQQILNAGLSFYVNNSFWPMPNAVINSTFCNGAWSGTSNLGVLQPNYLPATLQNNSYGQPYIINCNNPGGFYVRTTANTVANARVIAGRLPLAFITNAAGAGANPPTQPGACATGGAGCNIVVASVTIPGQNLNNARSMNFAGIYYHGACVPAPNCPPNMRPAIYVAPVSVSGQLSSTPPGNCTTDPATCQNIQAFPISSFNAYARGWTLANPSPIPSSGSGWTMSAWPLSCALSNPQSQQCLWPASPLPPADPAGTSYWRVCLAVVTQNGLASAANAAQGKLIGSIIAMTRCVPNQGNEVPVGSSIMVFQPSGQPSYP